jgi:hypothetical protein
MKQVIIVLLSFVIASFFSCSQQERKEQVSNQQSEYEWIEMDSFHLMMSEAFYPYQDSLNLQPVKHIALEIANKADAWATAPLPVGVDHDAMLEQLNQLKTDTRHLYNLIQQDAADDEIGTALSGVHASFHLIMEAWIDSVNREHQQ